MPGASPRCAGRPRALRPGRRPPRRKRDRERAPAADLRLDRDPPAEAAHHLADEGEAEADAGRVLPRDRLALLERLEDPRLVRERDAAPGVADVDPVLVADGGDRDRDGARLR